MAFAAARSLVARARSAIVFVAIVWGVAATFVVFEVVSLSGFDLALSFPGLLGDMALSRTVTTSTSCVVSAGNTPPPLPVAGQTNAMVGAWSLGVVLGRDALTRQFAASDRRSLDEFGARRRVLAEQLGVPPPDVFVPQQIVNSNIEFVTFVEQGAGSDTARRLAVLLTPQACELFKFGALWGYSEMVRPLLPGERAVFAMEIRYHALRAGVPEPLWSPMLERTPADATPDDIARQMETLTGHVTSHLTGQR